VQFGSGSRGLSLWERYTFPIFSDKVLENMGEGFRSLTEAPLLLLGVANAKQTLTGLFMLATPELKPSQTFEIILPNLIHKSKKRNLT